MKLYRVKIALTTDWPSFWKPQYYADGLSTDHLVPFMTDSDFLKSYDFGRQRGTGLGTPLTVASDGRTTEIHYRAYIATWAAKYALGLSKTADFIECGTGGGLLAGTIVDLLGFEKETRNFYSCDTYSGIPESDNTSEDELKNIRFMNRLHFDSDYFEDTEAKFAEYPNVQLVRGRLPEVLNELKIEQLAYVSMDLNNAFAEIASIEALWPKLINNAIILLDDYAFSTEFIAQHLAWNSFSNRIGIPILTLPTGQGIMIKQ